VGGRAANRNNELDFAMVKKITLFVFVSLLSFSGYGASFTSTTSGLFSAGSTWVGGSAPSADGDTWTIQSGHVVVYEANNSAMPNGWGACTVNGQLWMTKDYPCYLKMNGNIGGTGDWLMGDLLEEDNIPYTADNRPWVVIEQKAGSVTMTKAGGIKWYGVTNTFWGWTTNALLMSGDTTNLFFTNNVSGIASNDVVYLSMPDYVGRTGSFHMVYSVETNRVTLWNAIPSALSIVTNLWPATPIIGGVTNNHSANALLVKLSRPIHAFQPSALANVGLINGLDFGFAGGVTVVNMARGLLNGRNNWTVVSCCGISGGGNGIAYGGIGGTYLGCAGANNATTVFGSGYGGLFVDCIGAANASGGLVNGVKLFTIRGCIAVNNHGGGISNNSFSGKITDCVTANNSFGGICYAGTDISVLRCSTRTNSSAGIMHQSSGLISECIVENNPKPYLAYWCGEVTIFSSYDFADAVSSPAYYNGPYTVTLWNGTNFYSRFGSIIFTNMATSFSACVFAHLPTATAYPVPYYFDIGLKPSSTRDIEYAVYGKADCFYGYAVTYPDEKPVNVTPISGTGWVRGSVTLTNTLPVPQTFRLWMSMSNTNAATEGWSWVNVPTDYTVRMQ